MKHFFISTILMVASIGSSFHGTVPATTTALAQLPPASSLPVIEDKAPIKSQFRVVVFGYSSTVGQTDNSPFTTASGTQVEDGIVATNCLPFGTKVKIPELFGDKELTVTDRMAAWHGCNTIDVWYTSTAAAKQFGKHSAEVEVY